MSAPIFRATPALRQALRTRGYASATATAEKTAAAAKSTAESAKSTVETKAKELAAAGESAAARAQKAAGPAADKVVARFNAITKSITYNAKIVGALAKQVYIAEKLAPPTSVAEVSAAFVQVSQRAFNFKFWHSAWTSGQWKTLLAYAIQLYGIFKIGEIIGKRRLVGYHVVDKEADEEAAHH